MNQFVWAILAALVWGVVPLLEKLGLTKVDPLMGLFYRCIGVVIGCLILGTFLIKSGSVKPVDSRSFIFLVLAGFLASIIAQIFFYNGLKVGEVSRVVPIAGSFPLVAFILSWLLLGESISLLKILGVLSIIFGIWALKVG